MDTDSAEDVNCDAIKFYEKGPYFEFSNFYPVKVKMGGLSYPTSEHAYQAAKFLGPKATPRHREYAEVIRLINTPGKAKILATQKCVGGYKWKTDLNPAIIEYSDLKLRSDWEEVKNDVMRKIVRAKFSRNSKLRVLLLSTGNALIQENSPRDYYWGIGADGSGSNWLGLILMEVRQSLRVDQ